MHDPWLTAVGWLVTPVITVSLGAWVFVARKVGDHSVQLSRLESQMTTLETAVKQLSNWQHDHEMHVREMLQRLSRIEETLKHIHSHLNGKQDGQPKP